MQALMAQLTGDAAKKVVTPLEGIFADLPHLPKGVVEFLVKVAPWLVALGGVLSVLSAINMLQLAMNPFGGVMGRFMAEFVQINPLYYWITAVVGVLNGGLAFLAFKPLRERKLDGWMLLFWMEMLGVASSVVSIVLVRGGIVMTVIGLLIGFYILFEVKPAFKGKSETSEK